MTEEEMMLLGQGQAAPQGPPPGIAQVLQGLNTL